MKTSTFAILTLIGLTSQVLFTYNIHCKEECIGYTINSNPQVLFTGLTTNKDMTGTIEAQPGDKITIQMKYTTSEGLLGFKLTANSRTYDAGTQIERWSVLPEDIITQLPVCNVGTIFQRSPCLKLTGAAGTYEFISLIPYESKATKVQLKIKAETEKIVIDIESNLVSVFPNVETEDKLFVKFVELPQSGILYYKGTNTLIDINTEVPTNMVEYRVNENHKYEESFSFLGISITNDLSTIESIMITICAKNCPTCFQIPSKPTFDNCHFCIYDYYYYENISSIRTCLFKDDRPSYTYLDPLDRTYYDCHSTCLTCSKGLVGINQNCLKCQLGTYLVEGATEQNCHTTPPVDGNAYYLFEGIIYKKCHQYCKSCNTSPSDTNTNCSACNSNVVAPLIPAFPKHDDSNKCIIAPYDGYYLDAAKIWQLCYSMCLTCQKGGNSSLMNCLTCKYEDYRDNDISENCVQINCPKFWVKPTPTSKVCLEKCKYFIDPITKECIDQCPLNFVSYKQYCYPSCPANSHEATNGKYCLPQEVGQSSSGVKSEFIITQALENIDEYIYDFVNIKEVIHGVNYTLSIIPLNMIPETIIPMMDFTECESLLREAYNIPLPEIINMAKFVKKEKEIMEYRVYDVYGNKLDLSPCADILIPSFYSANAKLNVSQLYHVITIFNDSKVDVFDTNDIAFNDICVPFIFNETDVVISDRRKDIFMSAISFDGCKYNKFDIEANVIRCDCSPFQEKNQPLEVLDTFNTTFPSSHFAIITCFSNWLKWEFLMNSIGFWYGLIALLFHIILFSFFLFFGLEKLRIYLKRVKIPRNKKKGKMINNQKIKFIDDKDKEEKGEDQPIISNKNEHLSPKEILILKNNNNDDLYNREIINKEMNVNDNNEIEKAIEIEDQRPKNKYETSLNRHKHFRRNYLPYTIAVSKDTRKLNEIFWETCLVQHNFLELFHRKSPYDIPVYKLAIYLNILTFMMIMNALFYTNEIISEKYNNYGEISFGSSYLKSIYSYLLTLILMAILCHCLKFEDKFELLCQETKQKEIFNKRAKRQLIIMKVKLSIFFIVTTLIQIFGWHYMNMFCIIYPMNQGDWFQAGWVSFLIGFIISTLLCLIISFMFYYSLFYQSRNWYNSAIYLRLRLG